MSQPPRAMIYGATGYTGRLIARHAVECGLKPTLAGRNHELVGKLAAELDCPAVSFSLENPAQVAEHLRSFKVVLNCAGPFSQTARQMIDGCLSAGVDYLDITGEIEVIELAHTRHERARQAGVALIPAVGFDVVPSDCLAAMLAERLPRARVLQLAFAGVGGMSAGTAKTMVEAIPGGGRVRIEGEIRHVPTAWKKMDIAFRHRTLTCMTIPWGDVASAYYSTGIPNIEVYTSTPPQQVKWLRRMRFLLPLFGFKPLQRMAQRWVERKIKGPSPEERDRVRSSLWGRVSDDQGQTVTATLEAPSGYKLTYLTAVTALEKALAGEVPRGFSTASQAFGREFILTVPGTDVVWG